MYLVTCIVLQFLDIFRKNFLPNSFATIINPLYPPHHFDFMCNFFIFSFCFFHIRLLNTPRHLEADFASLRFTFNDNFYFYNFLCLIRVITSLLPTLFSSMFIYGFIPPFVEFCCRMILNIFYSFVTLNSLKSHYHNNLHKYFPFDFSIFTQ